jgi:hypothetical protein
VINSDVETRISLKVFHRHLLVTHLKDKAVSVLAELERLAGQSGEPLSALLAEYVKCNYPRESHFQEDDWHVREVQLDSCYFAHTDFRGHPVPKNGRFVDFMRTQHREIESGSFPCSSEIHAPWSESQMPEPLVREREPGKFYILDGQLRVIRHWYHKVPNVKVFIYRGQLAV